MSIPDADLKEEFIKCLDALASAVNWLRPPEPPDEPIPIPAKTLKWLNQRLVEASLMADKIGEEEDVSEE